MKVSYNTLYLKHFSVTDGNKQRLVRSKMFSIFKPTVRLLLTTAPSVSHHRSLGGIHTVVKQLEEHKKMNYLPKSHLLQTHKSRKGKGKPGRKGAKKQQLEGPRAKIRKIPIKNPNKEPRKPQLSLNIRRESSDP